MSRVVGKLENACLVVLLLSMVVLAAGQILLRNGFSTGFIWSDELLRIMVLWLALLGAVAASRDDRHITIDVLSRVMPPAMQRWNKILTSLFTSAVCAVLAWHSGRFVRDAFTYEDTVLGGMQAWVFQIILPLGFGLICLRYLAHAWGYLRRGAPS